MSEENKNLEIETTEGRNPRTMDLDCMSPIDIVTVMNREDALISKAIESQLENIATCVSWAEKSLNNGGRIIYMGAGTSGRLGVLDASECPPTFGVDSGMVIGLIAGGKNAIWKAIEGAEDNKELGVTDLKDIGLTKEDIVIGLAASGRTPYVIGGMTYAKEIGCHTVGISCNAGNKLSQTAELAIEVVVGPEILAGSTRLKAGTAQKMILNMISTAAMVRCGKAYQNLMVDVATTNEKLRLRAENIVMQATQVDREKAKEALSLCNGKAKPAILMLLTNCSAEEACEKLKETKGHIRRAL